MDNRVNINKAEPEAYKAMYALEGYLAATRLSQTHKELIKIRASQINGCSFCIDMHTKDALKNGESARRLFLLNAWKESGLFDPEEMAVLAITEEVTLIHNGGLSDETYKKAAVLFDTNYLCQVIMAVVIINAWNRIAVSTQMKPDSR
jgi:AhpD family alkylhydroperoxidase